MKLTSGTGKVTVFNGTEKTEAPLPSSATCSRPRATSRSCQARKSLPTSPERQAGGRRALHAEVDRRNAGHADGALPGLAGRVAGHGRRALSGRGDGQDAVRAVLVPAHRDVSAGRSSWAWACSSSIGAASAMRCRWRRGMGHRAHTTAWSSGAWSPKRWSLAARARRAPMPTCRLPAWCRSRCCRWSLSRRSWFCCGVEEGRRA